MRAASNFTLVRIRRLMRSATRFAPALVLSVVGAVAAATSALAGPITYTETATASGSLGGTPFTNAALTLTMINNTGNVTNLGPGLFLNAGTITLDVTGFAAATFTDSTRVFSNQGTSIAGFNDASVGDILEVSNTAFATYALAAAIGPVSGTTVINPSLPSFPTTGGNFILNSVSGFTVTFTATTAAVPEPTTLALFGLGLAGLGLARTRRKRSP